VRLHFATLSIPSVLLTVPVLLAVPQAARNSSANDTVQESQVIRSTTRLVQVSVVVTDNKGEPITGLQKDDFTVLDEGKSQKISFFAAEVRAPVGVTLAALPPNAFTNRFDLKGQDPGAVTVVLFDLLNTSVQDQMWVRNQVIKFLKNTKPQDRVAVYGLTTELLVLHDFTENASALVNAATQFKPKETALYDASNPGDFLLPAMNDPGWTKFQAAMSQPDSQMRLDAVHRRAEMTAKAFEAIAGHVATIPARKSLVWVSGSFPFRILANSFDTPSGQGGTTEPYTTSAARALNRVNMAVYPVDATGVVLNAAMAPSNPNDLRCIDCIPSGAGSSLGMFVRQDNFASERMLADATGGLAFSGSNDIVGAMKRAFDDGRYAYTIGFYPDHGKWNGRYRRIKIQARTKGAKLRYRTGYFAEGEHADSQAQADADLRQAAMSPLDATRLGMIVSGKLSGPANDRKIEVHVGLDPKQLLLRSVDQHEKGTVDLYFVQRNAKGETVAAESQRVALDLDEKEYEYLSKAGLVLGRHLVVTVEATELRVLVRDAVSESLGSVTIPLAVLRSGEAL
jgi:VWFA-related protein